MGDFTIASPVIKNGKTQITVSSDGVSKLQSKKIELDLTDLNISIDNSINKLAWDIGLPLAVLQKLTVVEELVIRTSSATVTIPMEMLQQLSGDDKGNVVLSMYVDHQLAKKPSITLSMWTGDKPIILPSTSEKTKNSIQITLPYTLLSKESPSFVQVLQVEEDWKEDIIFKTIYDTKQKAMEFAITDLGTYKVAYIHHQFTDVHEQHWARQHVEILASKGIIQGTSESTFDPTAEVRRGDFLVLLMRALKLSTEQPSQNIEFNDVEAGEYWYNAIHSAGQLGIVQGTKESAFEPRAAITREEMFVFIHRALAVGGKATESSSSQDASVYSDWNQVSAYAREAVSQLLEQGIVTGSDSKVKPKYTATRAEAATLIYRVFTIK
ncbi:Endo-1,4-beta-xylanase A precursor [compost metagenome]